VILPISFFEKKEEEEENPGNRTRSDEHVGVDRNHRRVSPVYQ
jgi:hypothetical protein